MADPVILASGSPVRRMLLENAGVPFTVSTRAVDEAAIRDALKAEGASAADCALALAELKAQRVSHAEPGALVIGCDQMLECNGVWFEKPVDRDHARAHLQALSGRTHSLFAGLVVCKSGQRLWHHVARADLAVRPLGPDFIEGYLDRTGDAVLGSVGAYQLEGEGAQLFSRIDGDFFTILGLPLLPLLEFLRVRGVMPT